VRREAYLAAGGLEAAGFSLTEDLALVQLIVKHGGAMCFPLNSRLMIATPGVHTWGEFMRQRKRWASGIKRLDPAGQVLIALMVLRNFLVVAGVLAGQWLVLWYWGITAIANFLIQWRACSALGIASRLGYFPFWEIFYTWSAPLMALSILVRPTVAWKDRRFEPTDKPVTAV